MSKDNKKWQMVSKALILFTLIFLKFAAASTDIVLVLPAPVLIKPLDNGSLTDRTPTFDWSDVPGATNYDLQANTNPSFSSTVIDVALGTSTYTPSDHLVAGSYYWRARARSTTDTSAWSSSFKFTITTPVPTQNMPANNSELVDHTPTFDWSDTPGATSYDFQLSQFNDFSSFVCDLSVATSTYTLVSDLTVNQYYWRVRAWVSTDATPWTQVFTFNIVTPTPTLWFPANNALITDATPRLDWSEPVGATSYDLQVAVTSDFNSPVIDLMTQISEYTPTSELASGLYFWHVRIHSTTESNRWCNPFQFTLVLIPEIVFFALANGSAVTSSNKVTLNNIATNNPTHYQASENSSFLGAAWITYNGAPEFTLSAVVGIKTVYFKTKNSAGYSNVLQDQINYQPGTGLDDDMQKHQPEFFTLSHCYPNPFERSTTIVFLRPSVGVCELKIYDLLGRQVRVLNTGIRAVGENTILWDGRDEEGNLVPIGLYYILASENIRQALKVVFVR